MEHQCKLKGMLGELSMTLEHLYRNHREPQKNFREILEEHEEIDREAGKY